MKKLLSVMLLAVVIFFAGGQNNFAEAARDFSGWQVVGIRTYLSIREYPTINSRELARIPNGTILSDEGGRANGFASVSYNGIYGWASLTYLRPFSP